MNRSHFAALACVGTLGVACVPPVGDVPPGEAIDPIASQQLARSDRVLVFYPPGACSGELEIEVFDRAADIWRAHPEHPRFSSGACAWEAPGRLLNELRVRCVHPSGALRPSEWVVGAELASSAPSCGASRP